MAKSIHDGHRERMRKEIMNNGFNESTPPHKILEFLLFYCISRKDTNPIAHDLINRFGSLAAVLDAPVEELAKVNGMSERSALLIKSIMPIARRYVIEKSSEIPSFNALDELGEFAVKQYIGITNERTGLISLDGKGKFLGFDFLAEGDINSVGLSFRDIITRLLKRDAVAAALVHNHPSGIAIPSAKDAAITEELALTLKSVGICLVDHIIVGTADFVSMAQSREYSRIFSVE